MTHTLKAVYFPGAATVAAAVELDFLQAVTPGTTGVALDSYAMGVPSADAARNNSLFSDNPRPRYSRRSTVVDVLTVSVFGSSTDTLFAQIQKLARVGEYARLAMENPQARSVAYLQFLPGGASVGGDLYAAIFDARVDFPSGWVLSLEATKHVEGITITIEREIWRSANPRISEVAEGNPQSGVSVITGSAAKGSTGSKAFDTAVKGDISALAHVYVGPAVAIGDVSRVIMGYRSAALGGANHGSLGKKEAESQTFGIIADTTAGADATASGGNAAITTFATDATSQPRFVGTSLPHGTHRAYARMRVTAGTIAKVKIGYQDEENALGAVWETGDEVRISESGYQTYDLGPVRIYQSISSLQILDTAAGAWTIYAERESGAGSLYVDYVFFMPTEGFVSIFSADLTTANSFALVYDETAYTFKGAFVISALSANYSARVRPCFYAGELRFKPGAGTFYWIAGSDTGGSIGDALSTAEPAFVVKALSRHIVPTFQ